MTNLTMTPSLSRPAWKRWTTLTGTPRGPRNPSSARRTSEVNPHPQARQNEYFDSKKRVVAVRLCYTRPTRSSWPLKQRAMGDILQLKEDLEHKITTWQLEVDLKLMKSLWGAHVRTFEEDELCVCEPF